MQIRATVACLLLFGCPCFCATPGQSSASAAQGILLGFSTGGPIRDNHYAAQQLSTAWIVRDKGTARVVILPLLVVPRANGFWRVGIESVCEMYGDKNEFRSRRNIVWSARIDSTPHLTKGPDCPVKPEVQNQANSNQASSNGSNSNDDETEATNGGEVDRYTDCLYRTRTISFVSPNYISETFEEANTEDCEVRGGRQTIWSRVLSITAPEMSEPTGGDKRDPMVKTLSDFAEQDSKRAAGAFNLVFVKGKKSLQEGGLNCPEADVDYEGWEIKRKDGAWTPWISQELFLGFSECAVDDQVPVRLPASLVGRNRVVPDFSELKKTIPELTDAFTSPGGDTTIAVAGSRLLVFDVSAGKLGAKLLDVDFPVGATPVMDQWALGAHVEAWTQQVEQWRIHPPPAAIVTSTATQ